MNLVKRVIIASAFLYSLLFMESCGAEKRKPFFDQVLIPVIQQRCGTRTDCTIRLSDATDFAWDKLYIFRPGMVNVEIEDKIGRKLNFHGEFNLKMLFMKDDKTVRTVEDPEEIEPDAGLNEIKFSSLAPLDPGFVEFSPESEFRVELVRQSVDKYYYLLHCINCTLE